MRQCSSAQLTSMSLVKGSSRACGGQHIAEKNCALGRNEFARVHAVENLAIAIVLVTDFDGSPRETPSVGRDPDCLATVAFAHHATKRNRRRTNRRADTDEKIREHARTQLVLRVLDLGAD